MADLSLVPQGARDGRYQKGRKNALDEQSTQPTLLWRIPANAVSLATGATTASIKAGVFAARWGLSAGRQATYGIIGLNQTLIERILLSAGAEANSQSQVALRQQETIYHVDNWIGTLHAALSGASVLAASGFYMAENSLNWVSESSLLGLHFLNAIFGSTDTSRAVAALIQLMKEELKKPDDDGTDYHIETYELLTTLATFLFLQRAGRRKTEIEWRTRAGEVSVWDFVLDDRGFRADVVGIRKYGGDNPISPPPPMTADQLGNLTLQAEQDLSALAPFQVQSSQLLTDEEIKQRILDQLPPGSRATVTSETFAVKTVKVDIQTAETTDIEAPPGMVMISEHLNFNNDAGTQTIVFRSASKVAAKALIEPHEPPTDVSRKIDSAHHGEDFDLSVSQIDRYVPVDDNVQVTEVRDRDVIEAATNTIQQSSSGGSAANQKKVRRALQDASARELHGDEPSPYNTNKDLPPPPTKNERSIKHSMMKKSPMFSSSPPGSSTFLTRMIPGSGRRRSGSGSNTSPSQGNSFAEALRPLTVARSPANKPPFEVPQTQVTSPSIKSARTTPIADAHGSGYFAVHEQRQEESFTQTDRFSIHSNDSRPPSPTLHRALPKASSSTITKVRSQTEISIQNSSDDHDPEGRHHRRSKSYVPSLYSMGTKDSTDETLYLALKGPVPRKSVFEDDTMLNALAKDGVIPGQFPKRHLIWALRRFGRFASAAYGKNFLTWMGMTPDSDAMELAMPVMMARPGVHREHISFSEYTGLPDETIIKSSYLEPNGIRSRTKPAGFAPIIHFVTVDFEAKAIVMTCRGTLGFEDLLTDLTCDYADMYWRGHAYEAHRGVRDSARRLMDSRGGNTLMQDLRDSLVQYPEFGLVFVGHSLGGAVAALLAIMLSEPSKPMLGETDTPAFVTATRPKLIPTTAHAASSRDVPPVTLPAGRPIHVYAFGTPACVSEDLRLATRGLITTIINANDSVPYLSLGTLHDLKRISHRARQDLSGKLYEIRSRISERVMRSFWHFFTHSTDSSASAGPPPPHNLAGDGLGEDTWMWHELVEMRKQMTSQKLVPPGEIFTLESTRVFDRAPDESTRSGIDSSKVLEPLGRAATRIQLKYVKNVEERFRELRFTRSMFREHTPWTYENNLSALERGVYSEV